MIPERINWAANPILNCSLWTIFGTLIAFSGIKTGHVYPRSTCFLAYRFICRFTVSTVFLTWRPVTRLVGITCFFFGFFIAYTLLPRIIFIFLKRIVTYDEKMGFFKNFFKIFLLYFILTIPITIILYQAMTFGKFEQLNASFGEYIWATLILFVIITLNLIRLSLLWKKRKYINKIPFIKVQEMQTKDREWLYK